MKHNGDTYQYNSNARSMSIAIRTYEIKLVTYACTSMCMYGGAIASMGELVVGIFVGCSDVTTTINIITQTTITKNDNDNNNSNKYRR